MKTLIIGTGAMGCLFGAKLKVVGTDVTLFNRENAHIKKIEQEGLKIIEMDGTISRVDVPVVYDSEKLARRYDLVIVLVKTFATENVLTKVSHAIDKETIVLSLQNGVGNIEKLRQIVPFAKIGVGGTGCAAGIIEDGLVAHRGDGDTFIGTLDNQDEGKYSEIANMFTRSGLNTSLADNVQSIIWSKLMVNVAYNGLTAVTRLTNGDSILLQEGKDVVNLLVNEAVEVAHKEGITLLYDEPVDEVIRMGIEKFSKNKSSMLSDIINERKTEIDVINGAITEYGRKHSVPTPYNKMITNLIKIIEGSYSKIVTTI